MPEDNRITNEVVDFYMPRGIGLTVPFWRINKDVCEYSLNKGYPMIIWSIDNKKECLKECKIGRFEFLELIVLCYERERTKF